MTNWKVIFATAVIFGAGVLTGGLLVNYVQHCAYVQSHRKPAHANAKTNVHVEEKNQPHLPTSLSKQFLQKLDEELKLKPKQRETIRRIIGDGQSQICKTIQDSRLEIRKVLNAEQKRKFDELINKRQVHRTIINTNETDKVSSPAGDETNPPEL